MSTVKIKVDGHVANFMNFPLLATGSEKIDKVQADFDSEWNGLGIVAVFYQDKGKLSYGVISADNTADIPESALRTEGAVNIGFFGTDGTKKITTNVLTYEIKEGAYVSIAEPDPDVYQQILGNFGTMIESLKNKANRKELDELATQIASPFNNKGACLSTALPTTGNELNDTWYCTDLKYRMTWNGTTWFQSSLDETDYENELGSLKEEKVDNLQLYSKEISANSNGYIQASNGTLIATTNGKNTGFISTENARYIKYKTTISNVGAMIAFFNASKEYISDISVLGAGYNYESIIDLYESKYSNAKYFVVSGYGYTPIVELMGNADIDDIMEKANRATTEYTGLFVGFNSFDQNKAVFYNDRYCDGTGKITFVTNVGSLVFPVKPSTKYSIYIPELNRVYMVGNKNGCFNHGDTYALKQYNTGNGQIAFETDATDKFIFIFFHSGTYDYDSNKNNIALYENGYNNGVMQIREELIRKQNINPLIGANLLIFGDSITDCCNIIIDDNNRTSGYVFRSPSNAYVNENGTTVSFDMWPKILNNMNVCKEIRNYAQAGAMYKDATRTEGQERQNVSYQIDVALNDLSNPNSAFSQSTFEPDIIIFDLGINDGVPNDTYADAMNKTIYKEDGRTIDVDATIVNLDTTKFCQAVRKSFMRIKSKFPKALCFCALPIQSAGTDVPILTLHDELKKMANRYGFVVVDGTYESGIVRDFNVYNSLGTNLKDGLHPNELGQNQKARLILNYIYRYYIPFDKPYFN